MSLTKKIILIFLLIFISSTLAFMLINNKKSEKYNKNINVVNNKSKVKEHKNKYLEKRNFSCSEVIYNDKSIPVIMYHSIDNKEDSELRVSTNKFLEQMTYLKENNYTTLTLDELYEFFINNKPVPKKSLVITFDDGYRDNYENAYPILKKFDFHAIIFVVTSTIDNDVNCLTSNQIKEMKFNGIDIQSHTLKHDNLYELTYNEQLETLKKSKNDLEKMLNNKVKYLAYPYGMWNDNTIKALKECDYIMAFTTNSGWANKDNGLYKLNRVYINGNADLNEFKRRINNANY
ncbi:poly-beta-1,6-N-acetyl-D-glucosamine N-deacetylase precursor [Clostridium acetireducens DSM 10703]|jgi:peptidoglycan/xylan/chitin deacetylase (PgdA/CDA1 family)|uniref:Poly-beta-1,6-N-acetyl-D-glucosamine N-deacetylase n=1 Tax=Clostridium acetireducens DSM 10703 TaxID=1121290 RepID=A0A1E8EY93_9CLOT|nr:polysaccharide deacetylase family protein [Clostridium acetireducens]OFI05511.1 poly-beta-1,6-N-acetyl-D-glucosamine N-deacetylase precursor [Clostridium acetireducens DSM 10703]